MHPAIRSLLAQLGRRLLLVAIAVGCVVAFIAIAGGTDARTGQPVTMVPIISSQTPTPTAPGSQSAIPAAALSGPAHASSTPVLTSTRPSVTPVTTAHPSNSKSFGRMHAAATTTGAIATADSSSLRSSTAAPTPSGTATGPLVYHYVATRDVAQIINPQRESQGWGDLTTASAKTSSGCLAAKNCAGQTGACALTPTAIGTATSTRVNDGQYDDQYGNCVELISFS
jgi:hypothetical protein